MNILTAMLSICLAVCMYKMYRDHMSLSIERSQRQRNARLAYVAITELRDVVHGLGWSSHLSSDFSRHQTLIEAADVIGCAAFNMAVIDSTFKNDTSMFSTEVDREDYGGRLAAFDLGELNNHRDALLQMPNLDAALSLMGALMHRVMEGVNRQLRESKS
jgi:hypothetical protein